MNSLYVRFSGMVARVPLLNYLRDIIVSDPLLSGVEIGARASLGGLYVDFTYVLAEYGYYNVGIGYVVTNIFGF